MSPINRRIKTTNKQKNQKHKRNVNMSLDMKGHQDVTMNNSYHNIHISIPTKRTILFFVTRISQSDKHYNEVALIDNVLGAGDSYA
uniref:Uncharacterized protein n=1 Tax=Arundo donax TaxID=35708 RepID=A0A0A9BIN4_ARUDO